MSDLLVVESRASLERNGLGTFDVPCAKQLDAVNETGISRCGWSSLFRLKLDGQGHHLKRQSNHLTHALHRPFGEPSFTRDFRNISRHRQLGIPALQVALFGKRKVAGEPRAILLACGQLARQPPSAGQVYSCFYPKHIFLQATSDGYAARSIDFEKPHPLLLDWGDRVKDLHALLCRAPQWSGDRVRQLLAPYLDQSEDSTLVATWNWRLTVLRSHKDKR